MFSEQNIHDEENICNGPRVATLPELTRLQP